jgi:RNA polymerase sigma-70 factor (ECF subfamily)
MGNYDDANDLAQEVFVLFFRKIDLFRGDCRLKTWLYRIMVNTAKNMWKKRERRGESKTVSLFEPFPGDDGEETVRELPSPFPGPREEAEGRQSADALQEALSQLSPEHREAIVLRCIEDMSYEEIAEATGANLGTVKSRINRARFELRKTMMDWL